MGSLKILSIILIVFLIATTTSYADVKTYTHTVIQPFGGAQSTDDARIAAVAKADHSADLDAYDKHIKRNTRLLPGIYIAVNSNDKAYQSAEVQLMRNEKRTALLIGNSDYYWL